MILVREVETEDLNLNNDYLLTLLEHSILFFSPK